MPYVKNTEDKTFQEGMVCRNVPKVTALILFTSLCIANLPLPLTVNLMKLLPL